MNLFQWFAIAAILLIIVLDGWRVVRHAGSRLSLGIRTLVWLCACYFIISPDSLTYMARALGIGRGADVLLYVLTLAFIAMSFLLYARIVQLRRQITQLVRHLALAHPLPPAPDVPRERP